MSIFFTTTRPQNEESFWGDFALRCRNCNCIRRSSRSVTSRYQNIRSQIDNWADAAHKRSPNVTEVARGSHVPRVGEGIPRIEAGRRAKPIILPCI